ncbi:VanZ family protein [Halalkalibacter sp. AB-rgal2]|nr:VanZ family protein [Halalkalibacter sp. APA_J-10(15)]
MYTKWLLLMIWSLFVFILYCTSSFTLFISDGVIRFSFVVPDYSEFLEPYALSRQEPFLTIQKIGHFVSFFVLTGLLYTCLKKWRITLIICFSLSIALELIQPFFNRDGRILDIFVNQLGIISFVMLFMIINSRGNRMAKE